MLAGDVCAEVPEDVVVEEAAVEETAVEGPAPEETENT